MNEIQFKTNLIKWETWKDGTVRPVAMFSLKDDSAYGNDITKFLATEFIPDAMDYTSTNDIADLVDDYEDDYIEYDKDPVADFAPTGISKDELDAARALYMMASKSTWPKEDSNLNLENIMKAYFASPDVSKMPESELESVWLVNPDKDSV